MNYLNFFGTRRNTTPLTDRIKGCNSIITSKSIVANLLQVSESSISNFTVDNNTNEVFWSTNFNYELPSFFISSRPQSRQIDKDLSPLIEEYETDLDVEFNLASFSLSQIEVFKANNVTGNIRDQAFIDLTKIRIFEAAKITSLKGWNAFGNNNGGNPVDLDFPLLQGISGINNAMRFPNGLPSVNYYTNATNNGGWSHIDTLPIDLSIVTNVGSKDWNKINLITEPMVFDNPSLTKANSFFTFYDMALVPELHLPYITEINGSNTRTISGLPQCTYVDLKRMTTLWNGSRRDLNLNLSSNGGVIDLNIALQDYLGTGIHFNAQRLLDRNWIINWFDNNQNLVSTTNP
jgi:hypothetical protein